MRANPKSRFAHLHVHTQYSLLDGAIRLGPLFERAKEFGMDAVAMTDHGTMFGAIEFYKMADKAGIKPIIGCECYVAPRTLADKTPLDNKALRHLVLLIENQEGYANLCKLVSVAHLQGFYYKPRIDKEILQQHHKGLIGLSACLHGEIPSLLNEGKPDQADEAARIFQDVFGEDNFFIEVQHNGIPAQEQVNAGLLDMSRRLSIPMVATNDCHYLDKDDAKAHDVLLCVQTGKTVNEADRFRFNTDQLFFKSPEEMEATLGQYPGAIENTAAIADRCHIEFDFKTYHFPKYNTTSGLPIDDIFDQQVHEGFAERIKQIKIKYPDMDEAVYDERLEHELKIIQKMGFAGYFLIVADFIHFGTQNQIPVGPGRGSATGSMVSYALGITDLDPIEHGLIFERFLNPDRSSMPDIDVDFCINGREKVFKYVVDRYGGGDYVAQIITFGKLKTRAVIRDVGRALDIPLHEVDAIAKMVPDVLNITLDEALKMEPKFGALMKEKSEIANLIQICRVLEGLPRHASTHAAGVVIGDKPLVEYLPLYKGKKGEVVTQFDMTYVEQIGLVKFDFLGLRNLTVIDNTLSLIAKQGNPPPDLSNLDLTDADTYRLLSAGDTTGVFQLESSGMKDLLVRLKPENFADVTALVALYRPGPLDSGMVDEFVDRKHGRESVEYLLPQLEPILNETYGVILYQEQVMKIASELAMYSMADADGLRKAMGKKKAALMAQHRELFMKGAKENNIPVDKAKKIFDLMEKFGGYGFNKSHSAAYALIAFQTAYLKTHFPVELMAALLSSEMNSIDGVVKYIVECRHHAIEVLPPDINESNTTFRVAGSKIRFGLVAVKNVGEAAIEQISKEREKNGPFSSLFEFCERVELRKVNKRVIESLINCGAFDSTGSFRSQMMASLEDALEYGQRVQKERDDPQMGLFDMDSDKGQSINMPSMPDIDEWGEKERLGAEKESLGFYISGHPLDRYQDLVDKFANVNALTIAEEKDGAAIRIAGTINSIKNIRTKKGDLMAFLTIEDLHGMLEIVVFPRVFETAERYLRADVPIFIQGQVQKDENTIKILAETVIPIEKAESIWNSSVHIHVDTSQVDTEALSKLHDIMKKYPGSCSTFVHLQIPERTETIIAVPDSLKLRISPVMNREVNGLLGYGAVETTCSEIKIIPRKNKRF